MLRSGLTPRDTPGALSETAAMLIVQVEVRVKPEHLDAFSVATAENARQSILEPGIARFDVLQDQEDPCRFVLSEVYRTPDDPARHKATAHYARWRDTVAEMMAEPRRSRRLGSIFPDDAQW